MESRLAQAQRRTTLMWIVGLIVAAGAIANIWLTPASAQGEHNGLEQRVRALEGEVSSLKDQVTSRDDEIAELNSLLAHFSRDGNDILITGANLHITNGLGTTESMNGSGNLIVGYNELRQSQNDRTGSHNIVVGKQHNFSSYGGLVAGDFNHIGGPFASVSGGFSNRALGQSSSVSGGITNTAGASNASVSGGIFITQNTSGGWSAGSQGGSSVVGNFRSP